MAIGSILVSHGSNILFLRNVHKTESVSKICVELGPVFCVIGPKYGTYKNELIVFLKNILYINNE